MLDRCRIGQRLQWLGSESHSLLCRGWCRLRRLHRERLLHRLHRLHRACLGCRLLLLRHEVLQRVGQLRLAFGDALHFVREPRLAAHLGTVARHVVLIAAVEAGARFAPGLPKRLATLLLHHVRLHLLGLHLLHHHRLLHHRIRPGLQHHTHGVVMHERLRVGITIARMVEELAHSGGDLKEVGDVVGRVVGGHIYLYGEGNRPCRR